MAERQRETEGRTVNAPLAERRDMVLANVLEPLQRGGMRKRKALTAEDQQAWLRHLATRLAWLSSEWHDALREAIERSAEPSQKRRGGARNVWPAEAVIMDIARRLSPMAAPSALVVSWMRSQAGRDALDECPFIASALEGYLARNGRPPGIEAMAQIRERGAELRRLYGAAERDAAHGDAKAVAYLDAWRVRRRYLVHLVRGDLDQAPEFAAARADGLELAP